MSVLINLSALLDDAKCFALVRQTRWPQGVRCPKCGGDMSCATAVTTLSLIASAIFATIASFVRRSFGHGAGWHHQPLRVWILCLYFMG